MRLLDADVQSVTFSVHSSNVVSAQNARFCLISKQHYRQAKIRPSLKHCILEQKCAMSGLKNSPFGKRLRASHQDPSSDDDPLLQRQAKTPRPSLAGNPIFGFHAPSTSTTPTVLDSARSSSPDRLGHRSESPVREHKDYGDRFVPSRDAGDMRTTYNLMEEYQYGQLTPSKRGIPSESDALKG